MSFYKIPPLGRTVRWNAELPATLVKFGPDGSLVVLHATADPSLTTARWLTETAQLGLFGLASAGHGFPVPPALVVQLGEQLPLSAPLCLLDLLPESARYAWLNARPVIPALRLVLLRLSKQEPGQAVVEASRRVWADAWPEADMQLRRTLEQQCLDTAEKHEPLVHAAGWELVAHTPAAELLRRASRVLTIPGSCEPVTQLVD